MNKTFSFIFSLIFFCLLAGCKTKYQYIPVESVLTEYKEIFNRDSIYVHDSIFITDRGDTVFKEVFKFVYRDKIIRDSIYISDSISVPYPVEIIVPQNYVSGWQNFQIWLGRILLGIILLYGLKLYLKKN